MGITAMKEQTSVCLEPMNISEPGVYPDEESTLTLSLYVRVITSAIKNKNGRQETFIGDNNETRL